MQPLGEALQQYLKALQIDGKLKEVRLIRSWEDFVGRMVANATKEIYIKDKVLFVHLNSSVVRKELSMIKEEIIKRMNESAGERLIEKIVLR